MRCVRPLRSTSLVTDAGGRQVLPCRQHGRVHGNPERYRQKSLRSPEWSRWGNGYRPRLPPHHIRSRASCWLDGSTVEKCRYHTDFKVVFNASDAHNSSPALRNRAKTSFHRRISRIRRRPKGETVSTHLASSPRSRITVKACAEQWMGLCISPQK